MRETDAAKPFPPSARRRLTAERKRALVQRFDALAPARDAWKARNRYYHRSLEALCRRFVPPGRRVLELGCGTGDLLASLSPDPEGSLGIDLSPAMVERARAKYPALRFAVHDAEDLELPAGTAFDFVVASDLVGHLTDLYATFRGLRALCHAETRLVLTYYNFLWEGVLQAGEKVGRKMPQEHQNWLGMADVENLLALGDFRVAKHGWELLLPIRVPLLSGLVNAVAPRIPGLRHLCLVQYAVAEPAPARPRRPERPSVSVVVPCRNEAGNVDDAIERIPEMGRSTEIVFVDGQSTDGTVEKIERAIEDHRGRRTIRLIHQTPRDRTATEDPALMLALGKGDAVRKGFAAASGEVLIILDADLTVPPEDLPRFVEVLEEGKARFVNGSRLVYPLEQESMRVLNLWGNKAFSLGFTWLLGQPIKDTLCGTKVLFREDYERIAANRAYFGDFDPFGDFDLLFGAARLNMRIVDLAVRYHERTYGSTNISRFRHGLLLLRMSAFAARKLKFI
jgi:glycosyltransferase involved in cell wall biosynthesis/SAM-dependent methyltransferase